VARVSVLEILDDRLLELVDERPEWAQLASGFLSSEGPIWVADGGYLLFSDIQHDRRCRWDERNGFVVVAEPTNKANGMTLDADGRLIVCEHITHSLVRMDPDGTGAGREVLASHYQGLELNSPNDVIVASDGSIYFTDPTGGRTAKWGVEREPELDFTGVFRYPPDDGEGLELVGKFEFPNGLCLSPDESILYVNETPRQRILAFDFGPGGTIANRRVFADRIEPAELGTVDGMQCDEHGNVWVTAPGAIWIYTPAGERLGGIAVPDRPLNLHWGGDDWSWLFVTGTNGLYRFKTKVRPNREPFMPYYLQINDHGRLEG
jgi:gluconolactonase